MSTIVVMPPAAAARVAVSKPSHSVRPGSLTCTCVSTRPGEITHPSLARCPASFGVAGPSSDSSNDPMRAMTPSWM